jgi:hypothetical protein
MVVGHVIGEEKHEWIILKVCIKWVKMGRGSVYWLL